MNFYMDDVFFLLHIAVQLFHVFKSTLKPRHKTVIICARFRCYRLGEQRFLVVDFLRDRENLSIATYVFQLILLSLVHFFVDLALKNFVPVGIAHAVHFAELSFSM